MAVESVIRKKERGARNSRTTDGEGVVRGRGPGQTLLTWYDTHARELPWRIGPGTQGRADPYRVWLSEVMLQQTTVAAVRSYFIKFTAIWPTIFDLALADEADVMSAWAGLGYYARARNLHACAKAVVRDHDGRFPETEDELRKLPGIGVYTAAAIAAIAFGRRAVVIDANVQRVAARYAAIEVPLPLAKKHIHDVIEAMTPKEGTGKSGDFAQAMMDLGATICTVKAPKCLICPLADDCQAAFAAIAESLPRKPSKKARPIRHGWAWWVEHEGRLLFERRPAKGLLGGMPGLPGTSWSMEELPDLPVDAEDLGRSVQHVFTHLTLNLHLARCNYPAIANHLQGAPIWVDADKIDEFSMPTLYKKAVSVMIDGG